jgi:hypothetical protein
LIDLSDRLATEGETKSRLIGTVMGAVHLHPGTTYSNSHERAFARTARYAHALSEPSENFSVLLGIRSWF